jgi:flagellar biosynthesis/type III secretory pathway protein FliH
MNSSLKASRVDHAEARMLTATRFDTVLSYVEPEFVPEADFAPGSDQGVTELVNAQMMSDLIAEAESKARMHGFESGYTQGREQLEAEVRAELLVEHTRVLDEHVALRGQLESALEILASAASSLETAVVPVYAEVGKNLGAVVVTLVEELLGTELATDKAHVLNSISAAAAEIPGRSEIHVALHPADLELINSLGIDISESVRRPVQLAADSGVSAHGAVVTSECTRVDAQIESRIERLREALAS